MKTNTVIGEIPTRFLRRHNPESRVANQRETNRAAKVKDALPDSAIGFIGEHEALYFSNLRRYLQSDLAKLVMDAEQSFDDLECLKEIGVIQCGR